jgi:putative membrane-bound dehydrogenase-like protein
MTKTCHSVSESFVVVMFCVFSMGTPLCGAEVELNGHRFTLPDGFTIEQAASAPLTERPICCDFDHQGHLYVAESSGSNENVQEQLKLRPHRILKLVDTDGDGTYDERTVFADQMMFPEGSMWHNGSLYVAAPPSIWKLTDKDGDGVAEEREEWFDGKTLTGCANDLHGPYLGRDGWIYWCKGAFAEQAYEDRNGEGWSTRAAHIFRRHPDGGTSEAVMTGGMDNPVEVVFTPGGERIFTTTFLQHPGDGRRDGLIHAVYGGVYGKDHGVLEGHIRTGNLLPPLVHLGAAAPCGLLCLENTAWGNAFQHNVFACSFNMHKVTRHELAVNGGTFDTQDHDFLVSDQLDFHPTDICEDADGSLLVVDTGGWYKLCCPTSQLAKPDVLGAIYRIRRKDTKLVSDPWGHDLTWNDLAPPALSRLLADARPMVRRQATERLRQLGDAAVSSLDANLKSESPDVRRRAIWTLAGMPTERARQATRAAVTDEDPLVQRAAVASISLWRDAAASKPLLVVLAGKDAHSRRLAAEALGRIGSTDATSALLAAARGQDVDRMLEHSIIYALIQLNDSDSLLKSLTADSAAIRRVAMIALDQAKGHNATPQQMLPLLSDEDPQVRETALWIASLHSDWDRELASFFADELSSGVQGEGRLQVLQSLLAKNATAAPVQELIGKVLSDKDSHPSSVAMVLAALSTTRVTEAPQSWYEGLAKRMSADTDPPTVALAVAASRSLTHGKSGDVWRNELRRVLAAADSSVETRLQAAIILAGNGDPTTSGGFALAKKLVASDNPLEFRSLAADLLARGRLKEEQLAAVCQLIGEVGPLEIERVLTALKQSQDPQLGRAALKSLSNASVTQSVPTAQLVAVFANFPDDVRGEAAELVESLAKSREASLAALDATMTALPVGDIRRGQKVFHGTKTSCIACHSLGYLGGKVGPDLTRIGRIRSDRDLLEAILFPSSSFVRSYESYQVVTVDGKIYTGILREDTASAVVLTDKERKDIRIPREEIDVMSRSPLSIMPAGLDKQLTNQELADLLEFLKSTR